MRAKSRGEQERGRAARHSANTHNSVTCASASNGVAPKQDLRRSSILDKADICRLLAEALAAHVEAVLADQTVTVVAHTAVAHAFAALARVAVVLLLGAHVAEVLSTV
eukprot:TRINITY_DN220_c0_g2_i1.p1 TRINITY_DN220_c0_g2~~TRINITY_DN220_c0_g2_i1.p1  ORF type:complete len:108 (+),score=8.26 TRINITY_DN220_c0_g2_i1:173-496(+)